MDLPAFLVATLVTLSILALIGIGCCIIDTAIHLVHFIDERRSKWEENNIAENNPGGENKSIEN